MIELLKSSAAIAYVQIAIATLSNLVTVYYLKKAEGFTHLWPSIVALVTISLTQWLISRAMASGMDMGLAIATLVVCVMIGATLMGIFLFDEPVSAQKAVGFGIAAIGVLMASLAKAPS
jgi:multidrug transporter EmrE-like cation transporter